MKVMNTMKIKRLPDGIASTRECWNGGTGRKKRLSDKTTWPKSHLGKEVTYSKTFREEH